MQIQSCPTVGIEVVVTECILLHNRCVTFGHQCPEERVGFDCVRRNEVLLDEGREQAIWVEHEAVLVGPVHSADVEIVNELERFVEGEDPCAEYRDLAFEHLI